MNTHTHTPTPATTGYTDATPYYLLPSTPDSEDCVPAEAFDEDASEFDALPSTPDSEDTPPLALYTWRDAERYAAQVSHGWLELVPHPRFRQLRELVERQLDALGCETQPRPRALFDDAAHAISWLYNRTRLAH